MAFEHGTLPVMRPTRCRSHPGGNSLRLVSNHLSGREVRKWFAEKSVLHVGRGLLARHVGIHID